MGIFADVQPKINVDLLSQIQRHKLDFSGRPAAPAVPKRAIRRTMQIACATQELEKLYEGEKGKQKEGDSGANLFF